MTAGGCPVRSGRHVCFLVADHPTSVHIDLTSGWHEPWSLPTAGWVNVPAGPVDPLQDAPKALRNQEKP